MWYNRSTTGHGRELLSEKEEACITMKKWKDVSIRIKVLIPIVLMLVIEFFSTKIRAKLARG